MLQAPHPSCSCKVPSIWQAANAQHALRWQWQQLHQWTFLLSSRAIALRHELQCTCNGSTQLLMPRLHMHAIHAHGSAGVPGRNAHLRMVQSTYTGVHARGGPTTVDPSKDLSALLDRSESDVRGVKKVAAADGSAPPPPLPSARSSSLTPPTASVPAGDFA